MAMSMARDLPGRAGAACARPLGRVLIVDDHPFYADGLAAMLRQESLVLASATVDSVTDAILYLESYPDTDLILLDLGLPGESGLALFGALSSLGLAVPVVIISSNDDELVIRSARKAGAMGYLSKAADRGMLVRMVRQVSAGESFFPDRMPAEAHPCYLTPRQQEVLRLLADGLPNKQICRQLELTDHTVKSHLKAIFSQLGVHNRTECVAQARAMGLL